MLRSRDYFLDGVGLIIAGGYLFYMGLKQMKLRRRVKDTPRSKISSVALGHNVEVHGKIFCEKKHLISSPLSLKECACYMWELQKLIGFGKHKHWVTHSTLFSRPYLYLIDESQELAAIDFSSVEFNEEKLGFIKKFNETGDTLPTAVRTILETRQMMKFSSDSSTSSSKYRLKEKCFFPDQDLYVLGAAILTPEIEAPLNPGESPQFGAHKPDIGFQTQVLFDYPKDNSSDYLKRAKFLFTMSIDEEVAFKIKKVFISRHSEKDLVGNLSNSIKIGLIGGPILITIGIWLLMYKYKF